jgi:hypothetical protein
MDRVARDVVKASPAPTKQAVRAHSDQAHSTEVDLFAGC